jgi:hypothetical protein
VTQDDALENSEVPQSHRPLSFFSGFIRREMTKFRKGASCSLFLGELKLASLISARQILAILSARRERLGRGKFVQIVRLNEMAGGADLRNVQKSYVRKEE